VKPVPAGSLAFAHEPNRPSQLACNLRILEQTGNSG
jgi:hypothetical protein